MDEFIRKIQDFKSHDAEAMIEIIDRFKPLIKKYCFKLKYEDARQDLTLSLIGIIQAMPMKLEEQGTPYPYDTLNQSLKKVWRRSLHFE